MSFGQILLLLILAMVFMLVVTAKQNRRHIAMTDRKQCKRCNATFPSHARFCGRCGQPLV